MTTAAVFDTKPYDREYLASAAGAQHTIGLLLTLNRKIHRAYNRVRELNFSLSGLVGFDIHGKTVGIVGTGRIGRITAQVLQDDELSLPLNFPNVLITAHQAFLTREALREIDENLPKLESREAFQKGTALWGKT